MGRAYYPIPVAFRLMALHRELNAQMKIRITEPVFFLGADRKAGDILKDVASGPFRTKVVPGGLERIPQFVEMPEEIKQIIQHAASAVPATPVQTPTSAVLPPATFADATAAVLKPAPVAPKGNPLAARIRALATRRAKFGDLAASLLDSGEKQMTRIEADAPAVLQRANQAAQDELAAITDLGDSLQELNKTNS